jgi:hypothetical protein
MQAIHTVAPAFGNLCDLDDQHGTPASHPARCGVHQAIPARRIAATPPRGHPRSAVSFKSDPMALNRIPCTDPPGPTFTGDCHDERLFHPFLPLHRLPRGCLPMRLQRPRGAGDFSHRREDVRCGPRLWLRLRRCGPRLHLRQRCSLRQLALGSTGRATDGHVFRRRSPDLSLRAPDAPA